MKRFRILSYRLAAWSLMSALTLPLAGCQLVSKQSEPLQTPVDPVAGSNRSESDRQNVVPVKKLNVIWSDAAIEVNGIPTQAGVAAKAYLIADKQQTPVQNPGTFTFYAWQTRADRPGAVEPDKIWTFSPQQTLHAFRQDEIGPYFAFWLPIGPAKQIGGNFTVQAAFTPTGNRPVISDPTLVALPESSREGRWERKTEILGAPREPVARQATITGKDTSFELDRKGPTVATDPTSDQSQ